MEERRVLLVAAGELPDGEWLERFIGPERTVIAVDGGLAPVPYTTLKLPPILRVLL